MPINTLGKCISTKGTKHLPKFYIHFTYKYQQWGKHKEIQETEPLFIKIEQSVLPKLFCCWTILL